MSYTDPGPAGSTIDFSSPRPQASEDDVRRSTDATNATSVDDLSTIGLAVSPSDPYDRVEPSASSSQHDSFNSAVSSFGAHRMSNSQGQSPETTPRAPPALTFTEVAYPPAAVLRGDDAVPGGGDVPRNDTQGLQSSTAPHQPLGSPFGPFSVEYGDARPKTASVDKLGSQPPMYGQIGSQPLSPADSASAEPSPGMLTAAGPEAVDSTRPSTSGTFGPSGGRFESRPGTSGSSGYISSSRLGTMGSSRLDTGQSSSRQATGESSRLGASHASGWGSRLNIPRMDPAIEPYGQIDVGGHVSSPFAFDINNPPPFSGRENLNQSAFTQNRRRHDEIEQINLPYLEYMGDPGEEVLTSADDAYHHMPPGTSGSTNVEPSSSVPYLPYAPSQEDVERLSNGVRMPRELAHRDPREVHQGWAHVQPEPGVQPAAGLSHAEEFYADPVGSDVSFATTASEDFDMSDDDSDLYSDMSPVEPSLTAGHMRQRRVRGHTRRPPSFSVTGVTEDMTIPDGITTGGEGPPHAHLPKSAAAPHNYEDDDSPFAEVRASVSNLDDPTMPVLTFRAVFIGLLLSVLGCAVNTFFLFRSPSPYLPVLVIQVIAYPLGKLLAKVLPMRLWTMPRWLGGFSFDLNPCTFNIKEHTIIVMMASVGIIPGYGINTLITSEMFYNRPFGVAYSILYLLTTQLTGFSMAGLSRKYVIRPASMVWPGVLVTTTLLNTLHAEPDRGTRRVTRLQFFGVVTVIAFLWHFVPGYLFKALSYFTYACWIAPKNQVVNALFGYRTGLGMGIFSFDWTQISWIGSPLTSPFWAQFNVGVGFVLFYWIIVPILHFKDVWYSSYIPMSAIEPADRYQQVYNVSAIITDKQTLNVDVYLSYSPMFLTTSFCMTYMLAFALTTGLLVHTGLNHGERIWKTFRGTDAEPDDIHNRLMKAFPEVPNRWYIISFLACFIVGVVMLEVFSSDLPIWGYLVAVSMALVYLVPTGIMYAMTNLQPAFNLIAELIPGYAFPGRPLPGMIFKTFALSTLQESVTFMRDMKLGHYMKIPPRDMFIAQFMACFVSCFVQVGMKYWMFATIPDLCEYSNKASLICGYTRTAFTASVVWGLIGPARLFSTGRIYNPQLWMLLVGALTPVPFWLWCRRHPKSVLRHVNTALMFSVCLFVPPATGMNIASFLITGFLSMFYMRRFHFNWWSRYNYILSAALDVGTILCILFILVTLQLTHVDLKWWGNTVFDNTLDFQGTAMAYLPPGEAFGPKTWT